MENLILFRKNKGKFSGDTIHNLTRWAKIELSGKCLLCYGNANTSRGAAAPYEHSDSICFGTKEEAARYHQKLFLALRCFNRDEKACQILRKTELDISE